MLHFFLELTLPVDSRPHSRSGFGEFAHNLLVFDFDFPVNLILIWVSGSETPFILVVTRIRTLGFDFGSGGVGYFDKPFD